MNEGSGPARAAAAGRPPSRPPSQHQQPGQHHPLPSTPVQNVPPPSFHDHPQSGQPSPSNRSMSHDFHPAHAPPNFASPPPYGASTHVPMPFGAPGRPPPPPLQQLTTNNNMRSPSTGPAHMQSPYTRTPVGPPPRADSAGYPFPSPGPRPHPHHDASPVQQHRYPPHAPNAYPPRDSYSQPAPGPAPSPGAMGHAPPPPGYFSSHQVMGPQTPPVGTPSGAHPYLTQQQHSRSTSVQSQQSYPPQQPFASPVTANHPPPPSEPMRQHSQPPTPQGPPLSATSRQSAPLGTFVQPHPPSPYQQRITSSGAPYPPYPPQHQPPPHQHQQGPPPQQSPYQQQALPPQHQSPHSVPRPQPSPHPPIQRAPSGYDGAYDQQPPTRSPAVDPHRGSLSHSERDRSVSVSPKTRVPSLPSSIGHHSQASLSGPSGGPPGEFDPRDSRQLAPNQAPMKDASAQKSNDAPPPPGALPRADRASTPAKRKMDDRDIQPEDIDRQEPRPPPFQANGAHRPESSSRPAAGPVHVPARRKPRHLTAPIWAQPYNKQDLHHPNYHLRKAGANHARTNGSAEPANARQERAASRHVSPEVARGTPANHAPPVPVNPNVATMLGPWEQTFANKKPLDAVVKAVADFLYVNVVSPSELKEIATYPGIEFEIEAKLGCLVDRNLRDNARKDFGLATEAVVRDECPFHSSMTEVCVQAVVMNSSDHANSFKNNPGTTQTL